MSSSNEPEGDRVGFEQFVLARRPALLRTAYLMTGDREDAEDLVQSALIKVVPRWRRIADRPEPYVRTVLAREAVTRWRRRRWREESSAEVPEPTVSHPADQDAATDREVLRLALLSLPPRQRAVVVLRYFEDLTERETAATLGVAVGTVKSQHRDAIARLRRVWPGLDVGEPGAGAAARRSASAGGPADAATMEA